MTAQFVSHELPQLLFNVILSSEEATLQFGGMSDFLPSWGDSEGEFISTHCRRSIFSSISGVVINTGSPMSNRPLDGALGGRP